MPQLEERLKRWEEFLALAGDAPPDAPKEAPRKEGPPQKATTAKWGNKPPKGRKGNHPPKGTDNGKGVTSPNIICFRCHKPGHYAPDCKVPLEGIVAPNPPTETAKKPKPKVAPVPIQLLAQHWYSWKTSKSGSASETRAIP